MTDRPILFSAPMVRAILREIAEPGTGKTQTRRVLSVPEPPAMDAIAPGHSPRHDAPYLDAYCGQTRTAGNPRGMSDGWCWWTRDDRAGRAFNVGYAPGDRLWVRETWTAQMTHGSTIADARSRMFREKIFYAADGEGEIDGWWPSIHLPREFSRITLDVTDVRVERLQDISDDDARAEGVSVGLEHIYAPGCFLDLWDSINGKRPRCSWEANPWVSAVTFVPRLANIDAASNPPPHPVRTR